MYGKLKQIKKEFEKINVEISEKKLDFHDIMLHYSNKNDVKKLQNKVYEREKYINNCSELIGKLEMVLLPSYPMNDETKEKWFNLKNEICQLKQKLEQLNDKSQSLITNSLTSLFPNNK